MIRTLAIIAAAGFVLCLGALSAAIAFAVFILVMYGFAGRHFGISLPFAPAIIFLLAILIFGIVVSYTRATWLSLVAAIAVYGILKLRIKFGWVLLTLFASSKAS